MWSDRVVVTTTRFDNHLRLDQGVQHFALHQLIVQFAIETLIITVLPGTAGLDIERLDTNAAEPIPKRA